MEKINEPETKKESPVWAYIKKLETKIATLEREIEIIEESLRGRR